MSADEPLLLELWDGVSRTRLAADAGVPLVEVWDTLGSTQDRAHQLAQGDAAHGTTVIAVTQRAGRGRSGDAWVSGAGEGVWLSILLREIGTMPPGVLALRVGLALAPRLDPLAGGMVQLKWPNDLYRSGRKLAGILAEARWSGSRTEWVVVGIGINIRTPKVSGAIGLQPEAKCPPVAVAAMQATLEAARATGPLSPAELAAFSARDLSRGRRLVSPVAGLVRGIAADGALRVLTADGERAIVAGSVRFDTPGE